MLIQSVKVQQKCIVHRFRLKKLGDIGLPAWRNRKESEMVDPFILPLNQKAKGIPGPSRRLLRYGSTIRSLCDSQMALKMTAIV